MANKNITEQNPAEEQLSKVEAFILKYKKVIGLSVLGILVVVIAGFLLNNLYLQPRQVEASTELAKCQNLFDQEQFDKALNGDKASCKGFLKVADEYGCTDAGNLAHLYAGICYANLGKWQEAVDNLDDYSAGSDAMISPAAEAALGNAYAHLNQLDKAVSCLKKAASMADSKSAEGKSMSLAPTFLLQAGEILESQGKTSEALDIYKTIKSDYINSPVYRLIDAYIERCSK